MLSLGALLHQINHHWHRRYNPIDPTVIFEDGFESGDFSAWTGTSGTPSVQSTVKHHGTYAAGFDAYPEYCYYNYTDQTTAHERIYFQITALPPLSGNLVTVLRIDNITGGWLVCVEVYNSAGIVYIAVYRWLNGAGGRVVSSATVSVNIWYCLEVKAVIDTAGGYEVWLDGTSIISLSGDTTGRGNANQIRTGRVYQSGTWTFFVYVDCVVVADVYIGLEVLETIVAKEFPMLYYAESPQELRSKVSGAVITHVAKDFPEALLKTGKAKELRSKWE